MKALALVFGILFGVSSAWATLHKVAVYSTGPYSSEVRIKADCGDVLGASIHSYDCPEWEKATENPWEMFYTVDCGPSRNYSSLVMAGTEYLPEGEWVRMVLTDVGCPELFGVEVGEDPVQVNYYCGGKTPPWHEIEKLLVDDWHYSLSATSGYDSLQTIVVSVTSIPTGSARFGQVTIDYDSTETNWISASGKNGAWVSFTNENVSGFTEEQGNAHVLIQWQHDGFTSPQSILDVTFARVSCGAASLHIDDVEWVANAPTHAITYPLYMWSTYEGNLTSSDGSIGFQCGGGGPPNEWDKPVSTWSAVKGLYR